MKQSFSILKSFYEHIRELSYEEKGILFDAIFLYQIEGIEPTNISNIYIPFVFFKNQFRVEDNQYQKIVDRNRINGRKGGRPVNPVGLLVEKKDEINNLNYDNKRT